MPLNIVDTLETAEFASHNLIELNANNIKGIGFYDQLSDVFTQNANQRCLGFLAIVVGDGNQGAYQYTGTTLDSWALPENWTALGSTTDEDPIVQGYTLDLESSVVMSGEYDDSSSSAFKCDFTKVPAQFELRFDGNPSFPYDINTRGLHANVPTFSQHWTHNSGPLAGVTSGTVLPGQISVKVQASWGREFNPYTSLNDGFVGLSSGAMQVAASGSWQTNGSGSAAELELVNFLTALPSSVYSDLNWLYLGDYLSQPLYLLYSPWEVTTPSNELGNADCWTPVQGAPMSATITRDAGNGVMLANTDLSQRIVYPVSKRAHLVTVSDVRTNGFATVGDLEDMRIVIDLPAAVKTHMNDYITNKSEHPIIDFRATIYVEL